MRIKKYLRRTGMLLLLFCVVFLCGMKGRAAGKKTELNKSQITMYRYDTFQLKLKNASGKVKWSSNKKSVATVTASGRVRAHRIGECVISAVYQKKVYKCTVKVKKAVLATKLNHYSTKKNSGKIILAGSSSIARWSSAEDAFAPYEVVNMALSGTTLVQWSRWYKKAILPYEPKAVVFYVGGNDLWRGKTPEETAKLMCSMMQAISEELPDTKVYFVSLYTNLSRKSIAKQILNYNKKVKQFCSNYQNITYIELGEKFNHSGTPLKNLLVDGLHPNKKGYKIWKNTVASKVKKDLKKSEALSGNKNNSDWIGDDSGLMDNEDIEVTEDEFYEDEVPGEVSQIIIGSTRSSR